MSLLREAAEWLADNADTVSVTIQRGADTTVGVPARIGRTREFREGSGGVFLRFDIRDYKIEQADYVIAGARVEPSRGDKIIDSSSGEAITYRVIPTEGEPPARDADRFAVSWRIHTERV